MPVQKRSPRKSAVAKLDRVFSLYIRARDGACVQCGTTENLTCGHVFSRVAFSTRWDEENAFCQCSSHNMRHEYDPYPFLELVRERLGEQRLQELHRRYTQPRKFTTYELLELVVYFTEKLDVLSGSER